jgi:hypothetical protein
MLQDVIKKKSNLTQFEKGGTYICRGGQFQSNEEGYVCPIIPLNP